MKKFKVLLFLLFFIFLILYVPVLAGTLFTDTAFVPGDPKRFDPMRSFEEIRKYAGEGAEFVSMESKNIRPDGTIDLKAGYVRHSMTTVAYHFIEKLA